MTPFRILFVVLALNVPLLADDIAQTSGDRQISGVYPHLTTYAHARTDGDYTKSRGGSECGIGAIIPWAGKLWMINYAAHMPMGSDHKLYSIAPDMTMTIHPESVGGTPAARLIHRETNQLLLGHYVIDAKGKIRVISPKNMPGRVTAIARHLKDPANKVYYYMMEGELWEADVNTLEAKMLYRDPLPGWHGKGGYTSQGLLVVTNNGESHGRDSGKNWRVKDIDHAPGDPKAGVLATYDGEKWAIVERYQFTDVTGPGGVNGAPDDKSPLWSMGWCKRAVRLKLLQDGAWHTYLLPKATHNNDPAHGWFTEWPRIREVGGGRAMMDMHGMFFDFPLGFTKQNAAGIRPRASHLRYVPDFCEWNGRLVIATDETSIQGNPLGGQPQSNLWFGSLDNLREWGPRSAYGGPWVNDAVKANEPSHPFHIAGYDRRVLHLINPESGPAVNVTLEIDKTGRGKWTTYKTIELAPGALVSHIFPDDFAAEWARLVADTDHPKLTAYFHYTDATHHDPAKHAKMFDGLASVNDDGPVHAAMVRPSAVMYDMKMIARDVTKGVTGPDRFVNIDTDFNIKPAPKNAKLREIVSKRTLRYSVDDASVIVKHGGVNYRLPKGEAGYDKLGKAGFIRNAREVESERELANIHGTFYELPLIKVGSAARIDRLRPVASHDKQIYEFMTWRGLLWMSGTRADAPAGDHVVKAKDGSMSLWVGAIDDLWKLGKPRGVGGPWKNTAVKAGTPSDPYLMTGYDRKTLTLTADRDTTITVEVDIDHQSGWHTYRTFALKAGEKATHTFPVGYSAHWVRVKADADCTATAQLKYE